MTATHHMGISEGPACDSCGTSEARCARLDIRCCGEYCTHFADAIDLTPEPPAAPIVTRIRRVAEPTITPLELGRPLPPSATGALCAETDPELFFPEKGGSTKEAKAICRRCDLQTECLERALTTGERFGIWGGLSERDRRRIARDRGITIRNDQDLDAELDVLANPHQETA